MKNTAARLHRATLTICACATATMLTLRPATAEPSLGIGLSVSFGQGSVDTGLGVRLFSDNRQDTDVATIGLDYMLRKQSLRATVGVARLGKDRFVGIDLGIDVGDGSVSLGAVLGATNTRRPATQVLTAGPVNTENPTSEAQLPPEGKNPLPPEGEAPFTQEGEAPFTPEGETSGLIFEAPEVPFYDLPPMITYPDNFIPDRTLTPFPWNTTPFGPNDPDLR